MMLLPSIGTGSRCGMHMLAPGTVINSVSGGPRVRDQIGFQRRCKVVGWFIGLVSSFRGSVCYLQEAVQETRGEGLGASLHMRSLISMVERARRMARELG
ncbi:conserved hypothetical protein [Ricinus communis]|uniref:Uncharacterized protein n=1 Tax=Ricinus communis TaxID=3988 RepID=B9S2L8_RICCO|nr:conserved hypothetical protein [Ricinus communis]